MKLVYESTIKFTVVHDVESLEDIKNNHEYAECIARLVCDESTIAGAVASYEILESKIDAKDDDKETDKTIYEDFMKNSAR